ncbi:hypothetical protein D3C77_707790 [compost metagenome]
MQRQGQGRSNLLSWEPLEDAGVAYGREHQVLVAYSALGAQQLDGLQNILQIVCRLAHAHEHHFLYGPKAASKGDLRNDLGAGELA